jgi:hypothetical protein
MFCLHGEPVRPISKFSIGSIFFPVMEYDTLGSPEDNFVIIFFAPELSVIMSSSSARF